MSDRVLRMMRATANGANLQTMQFEGRDHLVVPVVLMVGDIVVQPMHTEGGEFVPARVLQEAPSQWDGRPVVPGHPEGGTASANEPHILESQRFGLVFNTRFEDGRLKADAWIDAARAKELGGKAFDVVQRLESGEVVEISVGAWVTLQEIGGALGGVKYTHRWVNVASDHLAMLTSDEVGACSVEDGCGCPRAAKENSTKRAQLRAANDGQEVVVNRSVFARVLEAVGLKAAQEDQSISELTNALHAELRSQEPAFEGIVEVFLDSESVVFAASPEGSTEFFRREYSLNDAGEVTLGEERVAVKPRTTFDPLSEDQKCECKGPCACGAGQTEAGDDEPDEPTTEEVLSMNKLKELAARIIGCKASPFNEGDEEKLIAFGEERLMTMADEMEASASESEGDDEGSSEGESNDDAESDKDADEGGDNTEEQKPEGVTVSQSEYDEMKEALAERRAAREAKQRGLAAKISAKTDVYEEKDLLTRTVEELEQLAKALKCDEPMRDYSGKGVPIHEDDEEIPPPPSQVAYARALSAGKSRKEAMEEAREEAATTH